MSLFHAILAAGLIGGAAATATPDSASPIMLAEDDPPPVELPCEPENCGPVPNPLPGCPTCPTEPAPDPSDDT